MASQDLEHVLTSASILKYSCHECAHGQKAPLETLVSPPPLPFNLGYCLSHHYSRPLRLA
ncbi:predicted protein [Plenodomus lingam JN3]|uniref:Predicted protein n=1 Tax=Leptosphaeria maculans (strain JN3 / isolate v23.1.3 / race Av1-4-5-6-7-8) TaxID=985895 RepID=E4ZQ10_LEPMJ|nr:predicted protein [Plenodomus lingam JN3]CBX93545.1 predicted protein [Plenodomus lingam JN3]